MEKYVEKQVIDVTVTTRGQRFKSKYLTWKFAAKFFGNIFTYVLTIGIAFVIVYPLIRRVGNAFKPVEEFYDSSVVYFPRNPTFDVVRQAYYSLSVSTVGVTSFLLALAIGILQTAISTFAGYGFARFNFRGKKLLFGLVILTLVVPPQTILIPLFLRFRFMDAFGIVKMITGKPLNLIDTFWPQLMLAVTGLGWKNGLYIYMLRQYFRGVPKELEEAAYVDGAKVSRAFFQIVLPSAVPMMLTVFLFSFSWQWTDSFYSGTFLIRKKLLSTSIKAITHTNEIMQFNLQQTAILLIILPLILLFIFTQRYFVEGIERSGLVG